MANRYHTELLAVFVETPGWGSASPEEKRALEENLRFAEDSARSPYVCLLLGSVVQNLLRLAGDVDVHVVAERAKSEH
jgi:K+-sensing histidine kinase KdpD